MTHPTDEELDALVRDLKDRRVIAQTASGNTIEQVFNRDGDEAADAITALRAQLAEARERALREAAGELQYKSYRTAARQVLALIDKPAKP